MLIDSFEDQLQTGSYESLIVNLIKQIYFCLNRARQVVNKKMKNYQMTCFVFKKKANWGSIIYSV